MTLNLPWMWILCGYCSMCFALCSRLSTSAEAWRRCSAARVRFLVVLLLFVVSLFLHTSFEMHIPSVVIDIVAVSMFVRNSFRGDAVAFAVPVVFLRYGPKRANEFVEQQWQDANNPVS